MSDTLKAHAQDQGPPRGFYQTRAGETVCRLCDQPNHAHTPACPVMTLATQLRELTGQLGLFVATMRETLDALEGLLRGDAAAETREG